MFGIALSDAMPTTMSFIVAKEQAKAEGLKPGTDEFDNFVRDTQWDRVRRTQPPSLPHLQSRALSFGMHGGQALGKLLNPFFSSANIIAQYNFNALEQTRLGWKTKDWGEFGEGFGKLALSWLAASFGEALVEELYNKLATRNSPDYTRSATREIIGAASRNLVSPVAWLGDIGGEALSALIEQRPMYESGDAVDDFKDMLKEAVHSVGSGDSQAIWKSAQDVTYFLAKTPISNLEKKVWPLITGVKK
jgi:hypothetical protein